MVRHQDLDSAELYLRNTLFEENQEAFLSALRNFVELYGALSTESEFATPSTT
jgi:hypothetical protein